MTSMNVDVVVSSCRVVGRAKIFDVACEDGGELPKYEPGAHVAVLIPGVGSRCYSIASWGEGANSKYRLAVSLAPDSKGGSTYIHEHITDGARLQIRPPMNLFRMSPQQKRAVFVAGGIGITPIMAMIDKCEAVGMSWRLAYFASSAENAPFADVLAAARFGTVEYHFASGDKKRAILDAFAAKRRLGEHLYCCGPTGLMDLVAGVTAAWPKGSVHFERFVPAAEVPADARAFDIVLKRSDRTLPVPADKSVLEVLEENGVAPMWSCRSGMCGACEVGVVSGEIEHRDEFLSAAQRERKDCMMPCVSRSAGDTLWLDL